jgi:hypothetical protein
MMQPTSTGIVAISNTFTKQKAETNNSNTTTTTAAHVHHLEPISLS